MTGENLLQLIRWDPNLPLIRTGWFVLGRGFVRRHTRKSERSEQSGFANLLRGTFGMFRNPTAHEARINWVMSVMALTSRDSRCRSAAL